MATKYSFYISMKGNLHSFSKRWSTDSVEAPSLLVLFDEGGLTQVFRWGVRGSCERKVHLS